MALLCSSGGALVTEHTTCEVTRDCEEFFPVFARILGFTIFPGFIPRDSESSSPHGEVDPFRHADRCVICYFTVIPKGDYNARK